MGGKLIVFEGIPGSGKTTLHERVVSELRRRGIGILETSEPTKEASDDNSFGVCIRKLVEQRQISDQDYANVCFSASKICREGRKKGIPATLRFGNELSDAVGKLANRRQLTELERQLFFIADRWFHLREVVRPALERGLWVIMDRYELSTVAHYRMNTSSKTDLLKHWQYPILGPDYVRPDINFVLNVSPETAFKRQQESGKAIDIYEKKFRQMEHLYDGYRWAVSLFEHAESNDPRHGYPFVFLNAEHSKEEIFKQALSRMPFEKSSKVLAS